MKHNFPAQCPDNFVGAKHFRICRRAACGFTRRWGNEDNEGNDVYTIYTVDLIERVIYDRQVLLVLFAVLDCSMKRVRLLLEDLPRVHRAIRSECLTPNVLPTLDSSQMGIS